MIATGWVFAGFLLINRDEEGLDYEYETHMQQAHFCLAAIGAGWPVRLKLAVLHGCIPLVIAEHYEVRAASSRSSMFRPGKACR